MIIVKLMGGLGNQMFQYALGRTLSQRYQTPLQFDLSWLLDHNARRGPGFVYRHYDLDIFNIHPANASEQDIRALRRSWLPAKKADRLLHKWMGHPETWVREHHFHFDPAVLQTGPNVYLDGYWQSEKYFAAQAALIRSDFRLAHPLEGAAAELLDRIKNSEAVCLNVRRKEFVNHPYHGAMDASYYTRAEARILEKTHRPEIFVFSDEPEWCMENLRLRSPATFVPLSCAGYKYRDILQLMTACKHFIIPNSSFGWWAAWLSEHPQKQVIAPQKWFADGPADTQDLLPESWERM